MSVSMLKPAKSDAGTKLSPQGRAAGSFWNHSEASPRDSKSPQEQRTREPSITGTPCQAWGCPWSENDFTWLGESLWMQGQGPVELECFPLQQQPPLWWARILCQQPCPGHGSWGTATFRAPPTAHVGRGKTPTWQTGTY